MIGGHFFQQIITKMSGNVWIAGNYCKLVLARAQFVEWGVQGIFSGHSLIACFNVGFDL